MDIMLILGSIITIVIFALIVWGVIVFFRSLGRLQKEYDDKLIALDKQLGAFAKEYNVGGFPAKVIRVYPQKSKVWILDDIYNFSDIFNISLNDRVIVQKGDTTATTSTSTSGTIGRAFVGKIVGGNTGAIIGAGTAKKRTTIHQEADNESHSYTINVKLADFNKPLIAIGLGDKETLANEILAMFELIINNSGVEEIRNQ